MITPHTGGPIDLSATPTRAKPGFDGGKSKGRKARRKLGDELAELQERLFAEGRVDGERRVLVVLQGMDTSGKGGALKRLVAPLDPQGVRITAFGAPTEEELAHDFLWRIDQALPAAGMIGVFDRSHYEDVLVARVRELAPPAEIERRYEAIRDFEAELVATGTTLIKVMLHLSPTEQHERLIARLENPEKHWKYTPDDRTDRALWPSFREAYEIAIERTATPQAPWYVVPADRKWFARLAVTRLLLQALRDLDPQWPQADGYDPEEERALLLAESPDAPGGSPTMATR